MMKFILIMAVFFVPNSVYAEAFSHKNTVEGIGSILTRDDGDFIILSGFSSAGTCPKSNGLVVARVPSGEAGNRAYSTALSAKMSGKKLQITVDDTNKNSNGYCVIQSASIYD